MANHGARRGATWTFFSVAAAVLCLSSCADRKVPKPEDGWSALSCNTSADLHAVWGEDDSHVYAVGSSGTILELGIDSCHPVNSGTSVRLNAIAGHKQVYAAGERGTILQRVKGSWQEVKGGPASQVEWTALRIMTDGSLVLAGDRLFAMWSPGTQPLMGQQAYSFRAVWITAQGHAFFPGDFGGGYCTILEGDLKSSQNLMYQSREHMHSRCVSGIWGAGGYEMLAVGRHRKHGAVKQPATKALALRFPAKATYDDIHWRDISPLVDVILRAVHGRSIDRAIAVGDLGTVLQYNGTSWQEEESGTTTNLNGVWVGVAAAFAVGDGGTVLVRSSSL
jgi:hypothetical protein